MYKQTMFSYFSIHSPIETVLFYLITVEFHRSFMTAMFIELRQRVIFELWGRISRERL